MSSSLFKFYPPKKKKNPYLVPNSDLLPSSLLTPLSKNAKARKFNGAKNKNTAFGPVNAPALSSALPIIPGPTTGGYGNSNYGVLPYGESSEPNKKAFTKSSKNILENDYIDYNKYKNLFSQI